MWLILGAPDAGSGSADLRNHSVDLTDPATRFENDIEDGVSSIPAEPAESGDYNHDAISQRQQFAGARVPGSYQRAWEPLQEGTEDESPRHEVAA